MEARGRHILFCDFVAKLRYSRGEWFCDTKHGIIYSKRVGKLKPILIDGYQYLHTRHNRIQVSIPVARAVWLFKNPLPTDPRLQIDHINGNKLDNCIDNLRLVTASENVRNPATAHLLFTLAEAEDIRREYTAGETSYKMLAEKYHCSMVTIARIIRRERYVPKAPQEEEHDN